jgi:hypothetical protein
MWRRWRGWWRGRQGRWLGRAIAVDRAREQVQVPVECAGCSSCDADGQVDAGRRAGDGDGCLPGTSRKRRNSVQAGQREDAGAGRAGVGESGDSLGASKADDNELPGRGDPAGARQGGAGADASGAHQPQPPMPGTARSGDVPAGPRAAGTSRRYDRDERDLGCPGRGHRPRELPPVQDAGIDHEGVDPGAPQPSSLSRPEVFDGGASQLDAPERRESNRDLGVRSLGSGCCSRRAGREGRDRPQDNEAGNQGRVRRATTMSGGGSHDPVLIGTPACVENPSRKGARAV